MLGERRGEGLSAPPRRLTHDSAPVRQESLTGWTDTDTDDTDTDGRLSVVSLPSPRLSSVAASSPAAGSPAGFLSVCLPVCRSVRRATGVGQSVFRPAEPG